MSEANGADMMFCAHKRLILLEKAGLKGRNSIISFKNRCKQVDVGSKNPTLIFGFTQKYNIDRSKI